MREPCVVMMYLSLCVYCECGVVWCASGAVGFDVCEALAYRDCAVGGGYGDERRQRGSLSARGG